MGGEQQRERRDLEPTGPPDRTYKVVLDLSLYRTPLDMLELFSTQVVFAGDAAVGKTSFINRNQQQTIQITNMHCHPCHHHQQLHQHQQHHHHHHDNHHDLLQDYKGRLHVKPKLYSWSRLPSEIHISAQLLIRAVIVTMITMIMIIMLMIMIIMLIIMIKR